MAHWVEITTPDGSRRRIELDGPIVLGREGDGVVVLGDPAVSRRHLRVEPDGDAVVVTDLGSSHGTRLDGTRLDGPTVVPEGSTITLGDSTLTVHLDRSDVTATIAPTGAAHAPTPPPTGAPTEPPAASPTPPAPSPVVRPVAAGPALESVSRDLIEVRFVPGTPGAAASRSMLDTARRARKKLTGLGSEAWGRPVVINLVDPFPDPSDPSRVLTSGTVVDPDGGEIWMAVTPESPPEDPHRPLAVLFAAALPDPDGVEYLVEGYGRWLAGTPEPDAEAIESITASLPDLDPAAQAVLVPAFVGYLIGRESETTFRQLLAAPAGRLGETWSQLYGRSFTALESAWHGELGSGSEPGAKPWRFVRLSWRYLRAYRMQQVEVFAYMLLSLVFTAIYPFVVQRLFDVTIPSGEMSQVVVLLAILAGAFAVSLAFSLRQAYLTARISGSVVRDLRTEMFTNLQRVPDPWLARHTQGDLLSRMMNDVGQVQYGLSSAINDGLYQALTLVVSAVIMLQVSFLLGIIVLVGAPFVGLVYKRMSGGAMKRSLAVQEDASAVLSVASENQQANPVVKVFGLGRVELDRFRRASDRLLRSEIRLTLYGGVFGVSVESIVTVLRLFILGLGAYLIFQGNLTLGGLVAFLGIMSQVISPVTGLTSLGQEIQSSMGALMRVEEVLYAEPEPAGDDLDDLAPLAQHIGLRDVALSYNAEQRALDGVDVTITAGSRVAFVGPSGSGKSSVLRILMRLYEPDEGAVVVDGVDVRTRSLESWRRQMGVVFQDSFLFDATVRENIAMGAPGATEEQIRSAAAAAEVDSFVDQLPRGYDSMVGEGGRSLSGGQRQRVAIARALVADPPILVLDEATSALDPRTERQINTTLSRAGTGRTVISVTHRLGTVVDFDRIFVVVEGRVAEQGTHDELRALGGTYARLWAEQTGEEVPAVAFDPAAALAGLTLFRDLDEAALAEVVTRLRPEILDDGDLVAESGDRLVLVAAGRAELVAADGDATVRRELGPGDVFGLDALMGSPHGVALRAAGRVGLLSLDGDDVTALAAQHSSVAEARAGRATLAQPPSGRTLARVSAADTRATATGISISAAEVAGAVAAARATAGRSSATRPKASAP